MNKMGSGRTWRLVNDARDGDIIIVADHRDRDQVKDFLIRQGRSFGALRIICLTGDRPADRLRGMPRELRVYVDHRAAELARHNEPERRALAELEHLAAIRFGGVHHYPLAEPCDTGSPGSPPARDKGLGGGLDA